MVMAINLRGSGKHVTVIPDEDTQDVEIADFEIDAGEDGSAQFYNDIVFQDWVVTISWASTEQGPTKTRLAHT